MYLFLIIRYWFRKNELRAFRTLVIVNRCQLVYRKGLFARLNRNDNLVTCGSLVRILRSPTRQTFRRENYGQGWRYLSDYVDDALLFLLAIAALTKGVESNQSSI